MLRPAGRAARGSRTVAVRSRAIGDRAHCCDDSSFPHSTPSRRTVPARVRPRTDIDAYRTSQSRDSRPARQFSRLVTDGAPDFTVLTCADESDAVSRSCASQLGSRGGAGPSDMQWRYTPPPRSSYDPRDLVFTPDLGWPSVCLRRAPRLVRSGPADRQGG